MAKQEPIALFPPHLRAIAQACMEIFNNGGYADKVIERTLKADKRRGSHDRAFIAENIYEIVRWYRLLYTLRGHKPKTENDWWEMIGIRYIIDGQTLPHWKEFRRLKPVKIRTDYQKAKQDRSIIESIPVWMDQLGEAELQENWPSTLHALNQPAKVVLRVNTLLTNAEQLQEDLHNEGIGTQFYSEESLLVTKRKNLFKTDAFQDGHFELQDYNSQQVAPYCDIAPGMRVIDACAGAGGKALHLATLMQNKGQIIALDTEGWKLKALKKRAKRNKIHIIEPRVIKNAKTIKRLHESADRVLLDVPCSGLGVLRRNPDTKWKLTSGFIDKVKIIQQDIIQRYSKMVKKEGKLIYATCSILPSENQSQVEKFLNSNAGNTFELEEMQSILPKTDGFDGFFMARMVKK